MKKISYSAVIVTFNPNSDHVCETVESLTKQGVSVIIVDNGSLNIERIRTIKNAVLIELSKNTGIAHALNVGMKESQKRGNDWVLSLDQDTKVSNHLISSYEKYLDLPNIGGLTPKVIRRGKAEQAFSDKDYDEMIICPTAGFFVKTEVWEQVGGYDDWMFIDYVDYDLCAKIREHHYKIYRINFACVEQELGKIKYNKFFYRLGTVLKSQKIKNFSVTYNHSPFRNYHFVRNALYYIKVHEKSIDVKVEKRKLIKWEIKKIILEKNRIETIKSIIRGIKDYKAKIKEKRE